MHLSLQMLLEVGRNPAQAFTSSKFASTTKSRCDGFLVVSMFIGKSTLEKQESTVDDGNAAADADGNFFPHLDPLLEQVASKLMKVSTLKANVEAEYNKDNQENADESESEAEALMDSELALMKGTLVMR